MAAPPVVDLPFVDEQLAQDMAVGLASVEKMLRSSVESEDAFITEASKHLIEAGGKRFRATLVLLGAQFGAFDSPGVVPGAVVRRGSHIGKGVVLMPSFVNIGAYVGDGSMVDTWATVGSCAQIGRNVHLSGGVGIGGVLEPLQAGPVVIEDGCFIGARSEVVEGVRVCEGAVLSMGVFIGASTKIVDRATGEVHIGRVPPYAVVVPGSLPGKPLADGTPGPSLYCAVIVKTVDAQTRSKTGINELLRD